METDDTQHDIILLLLGLHVKCSWVKISLNLGITPITEIERSSAIVWWPCKNSLISVHATTRQFQLTQKASRHSWTLSQPVQWLGKLYIFRFTL